MKIEQATITGINSRGDKFQVDVKFIYSFNRTLNKYAIRVDLPYTVEYYEIPKKDAGKSLRSQALGWIDKYYQRNVRSIKWKTVMK